MSTEQERQEAIKELRSIIKSGDTVYSFVSYVSNSGTSRCISFLVIKKNRPICLDWYIERICGYKRSEYHSGVSVQGCGMDMCFSVVHNLSNAIFKGHRPGYKLSSAHL